MLPGVTLICAGGHYPGGTVLHWAAGAGGKGALLSGDIVQVVQDNKSVSFMWSFPNFIPLSAPRVEGVVNSLKPYKFDRVHGAFTDRTIWSDGKGVVERSAERYLKIIRGDGSYELQVTRMRLRAPAHIPGHIAASAASSSPACWRAVAAPQALIRSRPIAADRLGSLTPGGSIADKSPLGRFCCNGLEQRG